MYGMKKRKTEKHNPKSVNTFPLLSTREIISALRDISVSLTEEDMAHPSAQRMMTVYEVILDQVVGLPRQSCTNVPLDEMDFLPYPDIHQESAGHAAFLRELVRLMAVVGINDFSMRELRKPEAPGVRRILSAVINFIRFREGSMSALDQKMRQSEELLEERMRLIHEHEQMKERLEALRVQRSQEQPEIEERERENEELQGQLRALLAEQGRLTAETDGLKERKAQLIERIQSLQEEFTLCQEENEVLRARIVHSPEKIQQEIKETSMRLSETKSLIVGSEQREREMRGRVAGLSQVDDDIRTCLQTLEECLDLRQRVNHQEQKVQEALETIEWKKKKGRELEVRRQQVERQIRMSEEKMGRLHKGQETRMSQTRERMEELNRKHEEVWIERDEIEKKIEASRNEIKVMNAEMDTVTKEAEAYVGMLRTDYHQLEAQIIRYQEEIASALDLDTSRS
ncbi:Nuf2 family-domain-containing protein [Piptocephalis cylindrospora]|uniref:Nuf2 family-domain-containing protein n=1 Tax=Piptocephalis cylindrospora TaxID=1907219 RepID=A0A4P9Y2R6_9FUNG|nr:Nuf2 family-domain-containing protein [Piptocephalis cylindrospora]|eukprot:RKP13216.1 Nuf2 family-domain-containing protein [Piptocephalis cylindrospora]